MFNSEEERFLLASGDSQLPPVWITRDGRRIPIPQLANQHLVNCILLIQRLKFLWRAEYYPTLLSEARSRRLM